MKTILRTEATPKIVSNPRILHGEPTVQGTRVSVRAIVELYGSYRNADAVQRALPVLPIGAVNVALAYYQAHRDEIDRYIAANEAAERDEDDGATAAVSR